jgi:hypothetical protein
MLKKKNEKLNETSSVIFLMNSSYGISMIITRLVHLSVNSFAFNKNIFK